MDRAVTTRRDWVGPAFGLGVLDVALLTIHWLRLAEPECGAADGRLLSRIWHEQLSCLSANEIGDFLAGTFAPLAFLGLAAALFIQSKELSAQREELEAGRKAAQEQAEAAREQAAEARRSGDYFKQQTEMLADEHRRQRDEEQQELFEALLEGGVLPLRKAPFVAVFEHIEEGTQQPLEVPVPNLKGEEELRTFHGAITRIWDDDWRIIGFRGASALIEIAMHLSRLDAAYGAMGPVDRTRYAALELKRVLGDLLVLVRRLGEVPEERVDPLDLAAISMLRDALPTMIDQEPVPLTVANVSLWARG